MNKRCDAEISRKGKWVICNKKAAWRIKASSGGWLEYCDKHQHRAKDTVCMTPAPFAKLEPVSR